MGDCVGAFGVRKYNNIVLCVSHIRQMTKRRRALVGLPPVLCVLCLVCVLTALFY